MIFSDCYPLRTEDTLKPSLLGSGHFHKDPIQQLKAWYREALKSSEPQPDAMTLATVNRRGHPSLRVVLLKGIENGELVFYTNYQSQKGRELAETPRAALNLFWPKLERQIRIEGTVRRLSAARSNAYWKTRPRDSQLNGLVSSQSQPIESYDALQARVIELTQALEGKPVPRPKHWGGFALKPERIEFWVAHPTRLHFRMNYRRASGSRLWKREILSP